MQEEEYDECWHCEGRLYVFDHIDDLEYLVCVACQRNYFKDGGKVELVT